MRQQLSNLLNGIPLSIWYDWKNDGQNPDENEHNFGTVTYDLAPKPAYVAIQTMTRQLAGFRIDRRISQANGEDYVLHLTNATGDEMLAFWTTGAEHGVVIDWTPKIRPLTAISAAGETAKVHPNDGKLPLKLTSMPAFLRVKQERP